MVVMQASTTSAALRWEIKFGPSASKPLLHRWSMMLSDLKIV